MTTVPRRVRCSRAPQPRCSTPVHPTHRETLEPPSVIADQIANALGAVLEALALPVPAGGVEVTPAKSREHGDWQSNVALVLAREAKTSPRDLAARIVEGLAPGAAPHVERTELAGPGFINFFLAPSWLHDVLRAVIAAGDEYGRGHTYDGLRVNLEFVSANPTGPLH